MTRVLLGRIDRHPDRLDHVTLESGRSLPVLVGDEGDPALAVFWYGAGGPIDDRRIYPPYYQATVRLGAPDVVTFAPLDASALGVRAGPDGSVGPQRITGFGPRAVTDALRETMYASLDRLAPSYLRPAGALGADARAAGRDYLAAYERLVQDALRGAYRAYSPRFFAWVEAIA
jgi:hypothetical protein